MLQHLKEIYDSCKNHPYVNEITIENAISYYNIYRKIFGIIYGDLGKEYTVDFDRKYTIPQLALLTVDSHDISLMYTQFCCKKDDDIKRFESLKEIHHTYMMELLDVLGSLFDKNIKKEYVNIWYDKRYKTGYKWTPFLFKLSEIKPGVWKGVNCIRESKWDICIEKYKNIIEEEKKYHNDIAAKAYQEELDDIINKTNKYHSIIPDDEYLKYKYGEE
jgi:hypothetical protein